MFDRMSHEIITVGRDRRRDIRIRDDSVSRFHCIITPGSSPGSYCIRDCEARNGIYVSERGKPESDRRVDHHPLTLGMTLQLGNVTIVPVDARGESPALGKYHAGSRARREAMTYLVRFVLSIARKTNDE